MKNIYEKYFDGIQTCLWCQTMDLLAIIKDKKTLNIFLYPNFNKISSVTVENEITSISWRPDGKFLSISTNNGEIILYCIEDNKIHFTYSVDETIIKTSWINLSKEKKITNILPEIGEKIEESERPVQFDPLNPLIHCNFNILVLMSQNSIEIRSFGVIQIFKSKITNILDVSLMNDLLSFVYFSENELYELSIINLTFQKKLKEISEAWINIYYLYQKYKESIELFIKEFTKIETFENHKESLLTFITIGKASDEISNIISENYLKNQLNILEKKKEYISMIFLNYIIPILEYIIIQFSNLEIYYQMENISSQNLKLEIEYFENLLKKMRIVFTYSNQKIKLILNLINCLQRVKKENSIKDLIQYYKMKNQDEIVMSLKEYIQFKSNKIETQTKLVQNIQLSIDPEIQIRFSIFEDEQHLSFISDGALHLYSYNKKGLKNDIIRQDLDGIKDFSIYKNEAIYLLKERQLDIIPLNETVEEQNLSLDHDILQMSFSQRGLTCLFSQKKFFIYSLDE